VDGNGCQAVISIFWTRVVSVLLQTRRRSSCGLHLQRPRASWRRAQVYYRPMFVDCNPLTLLLRFVLDLSYKLFRHCCATVGNILSHTLRRAVRLRFSASCYVCNLGRSYLDAGINVPHPSNGIIRCGTLINFNATRTES